LCLLRVFVPLGPEQAISSVHEAVGPTVDAAKIVLDKIRKIRPDGVEMKFGIKVSGTANWLVAKAAGEGTKQFISFRTSPYAV
jgi:hypothetical protein